MTEFVGFQTHIVILDRNGMTFDFYSNLAHHTVNVFKAPFPLQRNPAIIGFKTFLKSYLGIHILIRKSKFEFKNKNTL